MNCAFDKEKLTGYYDGELEAAEKAEVERHIASCSECLRELGELKSAAILVKELPRLRAPRSIAEGVSRDIQAAGKVHNFAKVRRTILWASAAAAALFVGLNVMYFTSSEKSPSTSTAMAPAPTAPPVVGRVQQLEELKAGAEKESVPARRLAQDRTADEAKSGELRKAVEEQSKGLQARDDAARKAAEAPAERAREKEKGDGLAGKVAPEPKPAEPAAPPKPAAPPGATPAPVAKPAAAPPPAPEAAEKTPSKKDSENLARAESDLKSNKRGAGPEPAAEAPPTHLTLASTQISKARPQLEEALKKIGVTLPPPPAPVKNLMKAPAIRETETPIPLELTDAQIARLRQELDKPGTSRLLNVAPGDPVLAEFRSGGVFAGKKESGAVASGGAAQGAKAKDFGKADPKAETKDGKESKDTDAATRLPADGLTDKSAGTRRKVVLHLIEVTHVPDVQPAPDAIKK